MAVASRQIANLVERHLGENAADDLYAKAMVTICDGHPPDCSHAHTCLHGGECFAGQQDIRAARAIERAAVSEDGGVRALMVAAACAVRAGKVSCGDVLDFRRNAA